MARRFQTRRFNTSGPRRKTTWAGSITSGLTVPQTISAATAAIFAQVDFRLAVNNIFISATIVRTRGRFHIRPLGATSGADPFGAIGMMLVNGEAFDAGIASIPTSF